ncbi:hypothetical protein [Microbacterium sp. TWP3-1-2b2]|uniref:hypothetical protein n=1 Tax=Microbacterium sp. TWP3-1-2b2 TaxID=2804651 RepID=UPI003CF7898F
MLNESESAELRMLQAKAYGRDGVLSAAELARLRELERTRHPEVIEPSATPLAETVESFEAEAPDPSTGPAGDSTETAGASTRRGGDSEATELPAAEPVEASGPSAGPTARRRWPVIAAASAAILAIGLGIGWGIWGWDAHSFALAAAHADQRTEIEASEDFDAGTVIPVAEQYGVVVWRAERSDGDEVCVIVTGPDKTIGHGCIGSEQLDASVWPNASATVPEGEDKAGHQLVAGLIPTATGELVPFIQVWDQSRVDWESQYSESELAQLREVEAAGYEGSTLSILGYDGDTVVWSNWASSEFCVIAAVDGGPIEACADNTQSDVNLTLAVIVDGIPTEYVVRQSEMRGPQLTIIRHPEAVKAEVDPETGDPIEFTFDDPMFDDLVSDGETGETGG